MNRLTFKELNGEWGIVGMNSENESEKLYSVASKLLAYEETGLSPEEIQGAYDICIEHEGNFTKLLDEKRKNMILEEQGRLIKLPYEIEMYQKQFESAEAMLNDIYQGGIIGETAYNVINQLLQSIRDIITKEES